MRKIWVMCFLMWLAAGCVTQVFAVQTVCFSVPEVECEPNRLVQLPCVASGTGKFCAATFSFQYDKSLLEIRKVTPYTGAKAVFHQADTLMISFVHADGIELSASPVIFTLECKVTGEGTTPVRFEVSDCVDSDVEFMQIGTCTGGSVTAEKAAQTAAQTASGSSGGILIQQSGVQSGAKSGSSAKSQSPGKGEESTTKPTVPVSEEKQHAVDVNQVISIAVLTASIIGGMIFFSWFIPKMIKDYKAKKKPAAKDAPEDREK